VATDFFVDACVDTAIARSQLAQAAIASLDPPQGKWTPFHKDIKKISDQLDQLRGPTRANCP
jgi:hypothetical protein